MTGQSYDAVDLRTEVGYGATSTTSPAITYQYPNGTPLGDLTYTYDALGNRIAIGGSLARTGLPPASNVAEYDANNRLIQRDGVTYLYNADGATSRATAPPATPGMSAISSSR